MYTTFIIKKNPRVSYLGTIPLILAIISLSYFNSVSINAQCIMGSSANAPCLKSNCAIGDKKCLKLKIHYINNASNGTPSNAPADNFFADFLSKLNSYFQAGNIEFKFDGECIHRVNMPGKDFSTLNTDLIVDTNGEKVENTTFDYKRGYINAYVYQVNGGGGYAWGQFDPKNEFLYAQLDPKVFAHELGHALSLFHTRANQNYLVPSTWECKGDSSTTLGDFIPDTDADPFTMDLDKDSLQDQTKWFFNCGTRSQINNYADACGNDTLSWYPPITNMMGIDEAKSCWNHFTTCQFSAMHCEIENNLNNYLTNCVPDLDPVCTSIIIDSPTTWTNQSIGMCAGQRITITKNGILTLIHTKITKYQENVSCPQLSGNWDGIYIEPAAYGSAQFPGGPSSPSGGKINVTQSSIIEYSNNGIQAPGSHNGIVISNSKMENNGMAIYSKGPGGLIASGSVSITASEIISNEVSQPVLLRMDGSNLSIQSGSIIKNLDSSGITGIKSYNGRLTVRNSTVKDFGVGIDKELNGGIGIGFVLDGNHILGNLTSVRNTSSGVSATKNFFQGEIRQFGKAYGRWHANNFKKEVRLDNPSLSYTFTENQFDGSSIQFSKNQSLTDARCNIWRNTGTACDGRATSIKPSWGSQPTSSGNRHDGLEPYMGVDQSNPITHYHIATAPMTVFAYGGQFTGFNANQQNPDCLYNLFPTEFTGGGGNSDGEYNNDNNNQLWLNLTQQLSNLETQAGNATGQALKNLIEQIADVKVSIGQSVLNALLNIDPIESATSYNLWVSRADNIVTQQITMISLWNSSDLTGMYSYINGLSLNGDDNQDRGNLVSGLNNLITFQSQSKNLSQLAEVDLDILIDIASSSFGAYTALLRSWLNIQYDIRIDPPAELNSYSWKYSKSAFSETSDIVLIPNPTSDCIELMWIGTDPSVKIEITDLTGKLRFSTVGLRSTPICLKEHLGHGLFIMQISSNNSSRIFKTKKLIIE